jgi:glutamine synthetase
MHEQKHGTYASVDEWARFFAQNPDIEAIDAFVIDANGILQGKRLEAADGPNLFHSGVLFSASSLIADIRGYGIEGHGYGSGDGDPDGAARPLPGTLIRAPWTRKPTAQVLCEMTHVQTGQGFWYDPRRILADVVAMCRSEGIHPVVACELEFYLLDPKRHDDGTIRVGSHAGRSAPRRGANLSMEAVDDYGVFLDAVNAAARVQGLPVAGCVSEYGIGQFEVNLSHIADPVLSADQAVLLKRLIKGVARSMGMEATFMAKPFVEEAGSGLHIHASIVDEVGQNRFGADGGEELLKYAIGGMQALLYDSFGLFAPNFNSQRRYLGSFVPTSRAWAENNRSVAFRIPAQHGGARRVEHRVAGADASPHLVMAAMLAGLLHGIRHRIDPGLPAVGRSSGGDPEFPGDLIVALDRLVDAQLLTQYIPQRFLEVFSITKRGEYLDLIEQIIPREYDFYV